jgi:hypothetical protein
MRRRRRGAAAVPAASRGGHGKTQEVVPLRSSPRRRRSAILVTADAAWVRVLETGLKNLGYRVVRIAAEEAWRGGLAGTDVWIVVVDKQAARSRWTAWSRRIARARAGVRVFVIGAPQSECGGPARAVWITGPDPAAAVLQRLLAGIDRCRRDS